MGQNMNFFYMLAVIKDFIFKLLNLKNQALYEDIHNSHNWKIKLMLCNKEQI